MAIALSTDIRYLKGVGEKRAAIYHKLGIGCIGDLLAHYPRDYIDFSVVQPIVSAPYEQAVAIRATVAAKKPEQRIRAGLSLFKVLVTDGADDLTITFFNGKYTVSALKEEETYLFYGKVGGRIGAREMNSPLVFPEKSADILSPVYPLTGGLSSKMVATNVRQALAELDYPKTDPIPDGIRTRYGLCRWEEAIRAVHFPQSRDALDRAQKRLMFEELFTFNLALGQMRRANKQAAAPKFHPVDLDEFFALFPFSPTGAQKKSAAEALADLCSPVPMNRLLQGDVGSGKTLVAAALAYACAKNGYQTAVMAPTSILAYQHYETFAGIFEKIGISVALLTGGTKAKEKRAVKSGLADGSIQIVVGTHALLEEDVVFDRLGLAVTDEQHRFGVSQRMRLSHKGPGGMQPHVLVMSATPIPRTLAFIIYGDLDLSILDEMPKGRIPIETYHIPPSIRGRAHGFIRKHLDAGKQGYVIYPLVQQGENTPEELGAAVEEAEKLAKEAFAGYRVGLLHGKMRPSAKEEIMRQFQSGELQLLVSTTVIEVGVDVPNAVIMLIENAERFGLSQLHQLRGRVGRGAEKSYCILVSEKKDSARLQAICKTNDGFKVAEEDLKLRGPGDFFGYRQHGLPVMKMAGLLQDMQLLEKTREAALAVLADDPDLKKPAHALLRKKTQQMRGIAGA